MALEDRYPELLVMTQFFPSEESVEWRAYDKPFSAKVDVLYVYGFSPYVDSLMEWVNQDKQRQIVFIEDRIEAIRQIACNTLANERVHLKFCLGDLEEFITEVVRGFPYETIEVISLHQDGERFERVKELLLRKSTLEEAIHTEMLNYHKLAKNLIPNFRRLQDSFNVAAWKDRFKGVPAVVCGAGPSLEWVKEKLSGLEEKALILAGGSTITALTKSGIKPHLLYAMDPNPEEFTRLAFHTAYDVPMIYGCRVEANIFYAHAGPLGYLSTGTGGFLETWIEEKLGIEDKGVLKGLGEEALSVTTIAFMTAIYFGCNPIILAGVDLAYDQGKRYAAGVISNLHCTLEEKPMKAGDTALFEGDSATMTKWLMERDVLNDVAKLYPDRTFIKATPQGLPFSHIPYNPDWDKLEKTYDLRGAIHDGVMETPLNVKLDQTLEPFFKSMKRCRTLVEGLIREPENIIYEIDLEEEIAFQIALKQTIYALAFHIKEKRDIYLKLQSIIEEYLQLA